MNINNTDHWIKLNRKVVYSDLFQDKNAWRVFTVMLLIAHYEDDFASTRFKGKQRYLKAGEFSISRSELAHLCCLPIGTVRNAVDRLQEDSRITSESDNKTTIFTVVGWKKYQGERTADRTATGQRQDSDRTAQQGAKRNKEIKNITTNVVIGKPYGKPEINEMFDYWKETVGYPVTSRKQANRNACNNLYKKYGGKGLKQLIKGVTKAQDDRYAPRIGDFVDLQANLNKLMAWGKTQQAPQIKSFGGKK
jgi:hypothetical protein